MTDYVVRPLDANTWEPFARGSGSGAGVYFVRFRTPRQLLTRRVVVTR